MRKLVVNVWADGQGYGPGFDARQPPAALAAELPVHVWGESGGEDGSGAWETTPRGSDAAGPGDDNQRSEPPGSSRDPNPEPPLDDLPKDELLTIAAAEQVKVDKRWGAARIAQAIANHRDPEG